MPGPAKSAFRLETTWTPAASTESLAYSLTLTNLSGKPVAGFRLCVSGPARIDPQATIEGGALVERLSNHSEFAPPEGFELDPDGAWTVTARGLSYGLRHWTDGASVGLSRLRRRQHGAGCGHADACRR